MLSLLALPLFLPGSAWAREKLFVFYPSLVRPIVIQDALAKKCPGLEVTVFGRQADFQAMVEKERPQAILAQAPVLRQYPDYPLKLQGMRNGTATEPYVLLSIDNPIDKGRMDTLTLGVVGMLERKEMARFVGDLMPGTSRINRVTKVEDLLPLLIFHSAAAVLVSETNMRELQKKSQARLVATILENGRVGLMALGIREEPRMEEITKAIKALPAGDAMLLGVDAWK